VHPIRPVKIFRNVSMLFCTIHPLTAMQNFTEIARRKPLRRGLKTIGVEKYSDVEHVQGYLYI